MTLLESFSPYKLLESRQYVYQTPRSLFAEIPPLLAKQKVTCTSGTIHEIENIVNILPKCGDFPVNLLEENVKEHCNLPCK